MSRINTPNLTLTAEEMVLLRSVYMNGNKATLPELRAAGAAKGMSPKAVESALAMLVPQEFLSRQPLPNTPGGYVYSITLKSMKKIRAENAVVKASDRQHAVAGK